MSTFFSLEEDESIDYYALPPTVTTHIDDHVDYHESINLENMYAGIVHGSKFLGNVVPELGQDYFSVGGFQITKGDGSNSITSQWPVTAPNINAIVHTHEDTEGTIVHRPDPETLGLHVTNLVVSKGASIDDPTSAGYRRCRTMR